MAEVPTAFREIAEKSAAQTKEMYEKMRVGAEEATGLLENTFKTAATGAAEFNRKMIENARSNANAVFDHAIALLGAKSLSEAIEVSTAHARKQFEAVAEQTKELSALFGAKSLSEAIEVSTSHARKQFEAVAYQTKELTALAQKVTTETAEPVQAGITKAFKKVA